MTKKNSIKQRKRRQKTLAFKMLLMFFVPIFVISWISAYFISYDTIKNTFLIGDIEGDFSADFTLKEHKAVDKNKDGVYELEDDEVSKNDYVVYPGVDIPKAPYVHIENLKGSAYLFVEIVGENNDIFSWDINDNWMATELEGKNGGVVCVYTGANKNAAVIDGETNDELKEYILKGIEGSENGGIRIADNYNSDSGFSLVFYGYLVQSSGSTDYENAWDKI